MLVVAGSTFSLRLCNKTSRDCHDNRGPKQLFLFISIFFSFHCDPTEITQQLQTKKNGGEKKK